VLLTSFVLGEKLPPVNRLTIMSFGGRRGRTSLVVAGLTTFVGACQAPTTGGTAVGSAWRAAEPRSSRAGSAAFTSMGTDNIASVNGVPIARETVIKLLMAGHGLGVLEQLIILEAAKQRASEVGVRVTQAEIDLEFGRSLDALVADSSADIPEDMRRRTAESMLSDMLTRRNISRGEYMLVMERNAYLRKLAAPEELFDEAALREEYARSYSERVEIRHIQMRTPQQLDEVLRAREAGAEFTDLAARYSANRRSAERLGLLPPFDENDPNVPELIRKTAFMLDPGEVSEPIHAGEWYHLIRVERRIPGADDAFETVRDAVEQSLRTRLTDERMQSLHAELFRQADIAISDPVLRAAFDDKFAGTLSAGD
jgi:parvulin-like peptidyl-prolyl isomerase